MRKRLIRKYLVMLSLSVVLIGVLGAGAVANGSTHRARAHVAKMITISSSAPTFVGPAATGCASGCSLLTGPFTT
ncbi:MAG: hypothetical protein WCD11_06055, partial [Solirubrobacteraceae bacterium]